MGYNPIDAPVTPDHDRELIAAARSAAIALALSQVPQRHRTRMRALTTEPATSYAHVSAQTGTPIREHRTDPRPLPRPADQPPHPARPARPGRLTAHRRRRGTYHAARARGSHQASTPQQPEGAPLDRVWQRPGAYRPERLRKG